MLNSSEKYLLEVQALEHRLRAVDRRRLWTACAVALALHIGTVCAIAFSQPKERVEPAGEMTISIDLDPAMMAAASTNAGEVEESAPQMETPPEPDPVEEVVEETPPEPTPPEPEVEPVEEPPVEETPVETPPEPVVEPVPEPVSEPLEQEPPPDPPKEIVEAPPPPPAETAEVVMPSRPVTKARKERTETPKPTRTEQPKVKPKPRPKPQAPAAAAASAASPAPNKVGGSGARANPNEINRFAGRVRAAIERRKRRPASAAGGGAVYMRFTITGSGQATGIRISKSSGNPALDEAARAAVASADLPSIPAGLPSPLPIGVPIHFEP